jgi:hypothetical protein
MFFPKLNQTAYSETLKRRPRISIDVNEQRREFNTIPKVNDEEAKELLEVYFFEKEEESLKKKIGELENKVNEFFWKNPTRFPLTVKENVSSQSFGVGEFAGYENPAMNVTAVKVGDCIEVKYNLEGQNYFFQWDKSSSVLFISPKDSKLYRKYFDIVYTLDLSQKNSFGKFNETTDKNVSLREVADFGVDIIYKKHKKDLLSIPEIAPAVVFYEISQKIEEMERTKMEDIAGISNGNIKVFRYSPAVYFPTENEIGRKLFIGIRGKPKRIEIFINSSLKENPLTKQYSGTDMRKDYPKFLKHYSILPFEPWRGSIIGLFIETKEETKEILKEFYGKSLKDSEDLLMAYNRVYGNSHTLNGILNFLNANMTSNVSNFQSCIDEINRGIETSRKTSKSLSERTKGFEYVGKLGGTEKRNAGAGLPEEIFQKYIKEAGQDASLQIKREEIVFQRIDLNSDNFPEYMVRNENPHFSGSGGYHTEFWQRRDNKWKVIVAVTGNNVNVINQIKNGYKIITYEYSNSPHMCYTNLEFDGKQYKRRINKVYDENKKIWLTSDQIRSLINQKYF